MLRQVHPQLKTLLHLGLIAASAVLAAWMVLYCTPLGPGTTSDSVVYLETAQNLLSGEGFQSNGHAMTHYPPTYPLLLALPGLLGMDLLLGARWLQALFLAGNVLAISACTCVCTKGSRIASLCSILLFLAFKTTYYIHIRAWSEAPFVLLMLTAFLLLALYVDKQKRWLLITSAFLASLALTTRYAGITLLPPMLGVLLFLNNKPIKGRVLDCLILLSVGMLPLAIWLLRNLALSGSAANRTMSFHPVTASHVQEYLESVLLFWLPGRRNFYLQLAQRILVALLLLGGGALGVNQVRRQIKSPNAGTAMALLAGLFFFTYTLFLLVSISFFDALTPTDARILYPIGIVSLVGIDTAFWNTPNLTRKPHARWAFVALSCMLVLGNARHTVSLTTTYHKDGTGYTSRAWYNSETIAYIRSLPADALIYANDPPPIRFHTGRQAMIIPPKVNPVTNSVNADLEQDIETMRNDLLHKRAVAVFFDAIDGRWFLPTKQELETTYGLVVLRQFQDGTAYGMQEQ